MSSGASAGQTTPRPDCANYASVGQIVSFMSIAALLITRLEQAVSFSNRLFIDAPKLSDFFGVLDTLPAVRDRADAVDPGRVRGLVEFKDV
jgi:ATP-binding cassette subfamily B protein